MPSSNTVAPNRSNVSAYKDAPKLGVSRADSSAHPSTHTSNIECFKCGGRGHKHAIVLIKRECCSQKTAMSQLADRKSTRLNSSHSVESRMPSSA